MKRVTKRTEINNGNQFFAIFPNLINTIAGIITALLLIRIFLKLFNANAQNAIVDFIYSISAIFIRPFKNVFSNLEFGDGMIFELNTLIAVLFYVFIAWIIMSLFFNFTGRKVKEEFTETLE